MCLADEHEWIWDTFGPLSPELSEYYARDEIRVCCLDNGHDGPHEFVAGSQIEITFNAE